MIINLISGPRNISTALMYSFAQRSDTVVMDEPFYAHYLSSHEVDHPGKSEILAALPLTIKGVLERISEKSTKAMHVFIKNMGHHLMDIDVHFLEHWSNVFLVRDPKQLIASFTQVITNPTIQDIGLKRQAELFEIISDKQGKPPLVLDSNAILENPEAILCRLCKLIKIPFEKSMLSWDPITSVVEVPWAKFWYKNVQNSSGFKKQQTSSRPLPERCIPLYEEALPYYNLLAKHAIRI